MLAEAPISLFVKLSYWEIYRLNVVLTARVFRKTPLLLGCGGFVVALGICACNAPAFTWARLGRHHGECETDAVGFGSTGVDCVGCAIARRSTHFER
jgi:hypothetical protein